MEVPRYHNKGIDSIHHNVIAKYLYFVVASFNHGMVKGDEPQPTGLIKSLLWSTDIISYLAQFEIYSLRPCSVVSSYGK